MAETAAQEASPAPAIQIAAGMYVPLRKTRITYCFFQGYFVSLFSCFEKEKGHITFTGRH